MLMTNDNAAFSELLLALYGSAAIPGNGHSRFLTRLKDLLNLQHAVVMVRPSAATNGAVIYSSGNGTTGDRMLDQCNAFSGLYERDPMGNLPFKRFTTIEGFDQIKPMDLYYMGGIDLRYRRDVRICARFTRSKSQGMFSNRDIDLVNLLIPHLEQTVQLAVEFRQLDSERQLYADAISKRAIGILTLDRNGQLTQSNKTANIVLQQNDGIRLIDRRIVIDNRSDNQLFRRQLKALLDSNRSSDKFKPFALSIQRGSGKPDYQLVIKALAGHGHPVVMIKDPEIQLDISIRTLMDLYKLTASEATVAVLMAEGRTAEEVADELQVKKNTIRAHLRSMFAKMGVSHQSMLVALVLNSLASTN